MEVNHIDGRNKGKIMLFALSTCPWCLKTKELLKELAVEYSYVDIDKLHGKERKEALTEVEKWNPSCTFPSLIFNNQESIIGFDEKSIRERLAN